MNKLKSLKWYWSVQQKRERAFIYINDYLFAKYANCGCVWLLLLYRFTFFLCARTARIHQQFVIIRTNHRSKTNKNISVFVYIHETCFQFEKCMAFGRYVSFRAVFFPLDFFTKKKFTTKKCERFLQGSLFLNKSFKLVQIKISQSIVRDASASKCNRILHFCRLSG